MPANPPFSSVWKVSRNRTSFLSRTLLAAHVLVHLAWLGWCGFLFFGDDPWGFEGWQVVPVWLAGHFVFNVTATLIWLCLQSSHLPLQTVRTSSSLEALHARRR